MKLLAQPLGLLLKTIYDVVGSYGVAIIIFTIIAKILMYPLYTRQIKSTAQMSEIQPKVLEIQNKYKDDKEKQNEKLAELYEKEGYNPMGGCLPMFIQMMIIFPLFALLRNPIQYMGGSEEMLLAVHEKFLWIGDLSQPDLWILPIAAGVTTFLSFWQTSKQTSAGPEMPSQKIMQYLFPVMIVYMGRSFPAGVTIYWFFNTLCQMVINVRTQHLRRKMAAQNAKGKKKKN